MGWRRKLKHVLKASLVPVAENVLTGNPRGAVIAVVKAIEKEAAGPHQQILAVAAATSDHQEDIEALRKRLDVLERKIK